jgi:ribosome-associated translation inhibitor RaiA
MIDEEVETVLREIRERVISQPLAQPSLPEPPPGEANGNQHSQSVAPAEASALNSAAMARLNAHLTTTARAWDRLPPVFSNRSGTAARIEVWIKARLKIFSRWFTWEQVNFNAAVHHALGETLQALNEQDATIAAGRSKLGRLQIENDALRAEIQTLGAQLQTQSNESDNQYAEINSLRAQLQADAAAARIEVQNQLRETNALRAELRGELESVRIRAEDQGTGLQARIETAMNEAATNLAKLSNEMREREERLENEQRVCFKQLLLETNEAAVSSDRAQQRIGTLIEEMNQRIKQLEDSQKP